MPAGNISLGGTLFYGFLDEGALISSIVYNAQNDIIAVDDIRYGGPASSVPEPTTLFLLGFGFFGLAAASRKKLLKK